MNAKLKMRLENAKAKADISGFRVDVASNKIKLGRLNKESKGISARVDAIEPSHKTQRRSSQIEFESEDKQYDGWKRLTGVALARDLQRNVGWFKTLMHQFLVNVVGTGPKLQLKTTDTTFNADAQKWINSDWAKWCDGVDDTPLVEQIGMALLSIKREGDVVCVFDDFDRNDGTIRWFESDQIVSIDDESWAVASSENDFPWVEKKTKTSERKIMTQSNGIVKDSRGRVVAYVVTAKRGLQNVEYKDTTIIPRWNIRHNNNGSAVLLKSPWRFGQRRGQGDALTISNQITDIYEMIAAELQSAKDSAQRAGTVEVDKDSVSSVERVLINSGKTSQEIDEIIYGDGTNRGLYGNNYSKLEGTFGGKIEYLSPGEKFVPHDHDRPASSIKDFGGFIQESSGASMGLGRSNSTMKAEASYTAYRGEQLMTWQTFYCDQKMLERRLLDFLTFKALGWAIKHGEVKAGPAKWHEFAMWSWPKMQEVDEGRMAKAEEVRLKNGTLTYADIYGPEWQQKFDNLSNELKYARLKELPLAVFEMKSGGTPDGADGNKTEGD